MVFKSQQHKFAPEGGLLLQVAKLLGLSQPGPLSVKFQTSDMELQDLLICLPCKLLVFL